MTAATVPIRGLAGGGHAAGGNDFSFFAGGAAALLSLRRDALRLLGRFDCMA